MAKTTEELSVENLESIKKLLILSLTSQGIPGKKIAQVLGVDAAIVSRILSGKK